MGDIDMHGFDQMEESDEFKNSLKKLDPPRILITPSPDEVIPRNYNG